jgi:predicted unusual protein kinase regulating ubiquinone biosynthesis (AarF/ABC1/UbiB family)
MSQSDKAAAVPSSRLARLARLGSLASGVAGGMLAEGVRQWSRGNRPSVGDLLLTPGNAQRVADQLSRLRGAAMKVGQLLSMDAGDLMPPELAAILARLRADAQAMPMSQLVPVLEAAWGRAGTGISSAFPSPAGRRVDWPGACGATEERRAPGDQGAVSRRAAEHCQRCGQRGHPAARVRPAAAQPRFRALLDEAKRQLHDEADYLKEAAYLRPIAAAWPTTAISRCPPCIAR